MIVNTFIEKQKKIIEERITKYEDKDYVLRRTPEGKLYQKHKYNKVLPYLKKALAKIKNGSYGICEVCGKEIPRKRLEAVPGALCCVKCDSKKKLVN